MRPVKKQRGKNWEPVKRTRLGWGGLSFAPNSKKKEEGRKEDGYLQKKQNGRGRKNFEPAV